MEPCAHSTTICVDSSGTLLAVASGQQRAVVLGKGEESSLLGSCGGGSQVVRGNEKMDRVLFKAGPSTLMEFEIGSARCPTMVGKYEDLGMVFDDFCYVNQHIVLVSKTGQLKFTDYSTGKSQKLEIDKNGRSFKVASRKNYLLVACTKRHRQNTEIAMYIMEYVQGDMKYVTMLSVDSPDSKICFISST